jgi:oligo-1,6-glucosidase
MTSVNERKWWKEAVVYQVYPRSFKDSDGDGIGDLEGILSKLDYIKSLGIDVVWLNPIFKSPNADNGYDISDYKGIMDEFGTMEDFDELLKGMHARGIKLILDLVVNHSSDEHEWFKQSRSSRDNHFRDYYHWWPAENGEPPYRWSALDEKANAWQYDGPSDAYYLHYFAVKQPDLNWDNASLRKDIYDMMHYWFGKGIDGFRMDVISVIGKDTNFPVITKEMLDRDYKGSWPYYYARGPKVHNYLQEMNREVLCKYDVMTVAEGWGVTGDDALDYVAAERKELDMLYHFEGMQIRHLPPENGIPQDPPFDLLAFKEVYTRWDELFSKKGWGTIYLGNHDQSRMVSRWGNDSPAYRDLSSKMLTTFLLTMRSTPYYYAGDELGMTSIKFDRIEDYQDIETINTYKRIASEGGDTKGYLEAQKIYSRDNGRTPFQWDDSINAGFTTGRPWIKVNPDHLTVHAAGQEDDPHSTLNYFRSLVKLRKEILTLVYGKYTLLDRENPRAYCYSRETSDQHVIILLNFSATHVMTNPGLNLEKPRILLSNYPEHNKMLYPASGIELRPYEAIIAQIK